MEGQFSYQGFDLLIEPGPGVAFTGRGMRPGAIHAAVLGTGAGNLVLKLDQAAAAPAGPVARKRAAERLRDRKSTRLNSSHRR